MPCTTVPLPVAMGATLGDLVQAYGPPRSVAFFVTVNGEPVLRPGWSMVPASGDLVEVVILPRGGGDGKSILGLIAMIALSAFAPWAGGLIAGALGASSTGIIAGLAGAAILAGGGILINTLLAPKAAGAAATTLEASPTYSTSAAGNQARLYGMIPVQYGEHIMVPDYVSDPYQEFDGNDQFLHLLFGRGLGKSAPKSVRVGETVVWTKENGYTGAIEDLEIAFYEPGETVTLFPVQVETSSEVSGQLLDDSSVLGPFAAVPAGQTAQKLGVDVYLSQGLYTLNNDGSQSAATVQFRFSYRQIDDLGNALGDWVVLSEQTLTLATPTPQRFSYSTEVPAGRYEIKAERTNAVSANDRVFDRLEWGGLRAYLDGPQSFPDLSTMAVRVRANEQLSAQSSQDFRLVQCRILPVQSGGIWIEQETRSIAWAAIDAIRNTVYGAREPDSRIDYATFLAYEALWTARGDTFDGIFDTRMTRFDVVNTILGAGRSSVRFSGDQVSLVRDEQRALPSQVFTDRNIVRGSLEVTYELQSDDSADDVIVEYMDRLSWTWQEVRCTIAVSNSEAPARVRMIGPTGRDHAWREGIHLAADNFFRRTKAVFSTELEGRLVQRGDLVRIQSDMPQSWGKSGTVKAFAGLQVTLDREPETDPANTYIRFRQKSGEEWGPCKITWTAGSASAALDADDYAAAVSVFGDLAYHLEDNGGEAPVYLLGEGVDFAFKGLVTGVIPQGSRVQLEVVGDDASVYLADDGLSVPDYPAGTLLPPSLTAPVITDLMVQRELSVTESFVSFSAVSSGGAVSYEAEVSYDEVTWTPVYSGRLPVGTFQVRRDALWLRVRANGKLPGPWAVRVVPVAPNVVRLPDGSVTTPSIAPGAITVDLIAELAVTAEKVAANAIEADKLADGAVSAAKIADEAVTASKLVDEAVTALKLAPLAVTAEKVAANAIEVEKLADGAVSADKLAELAVTSDKVAANAITAAKLANGAVTASAIAPQAVSSSALVNEAVTAAKLASGSVTAEKILAGAVGADQIAANAIAAKHLLISDFSNLVPDNTLSDIAGAWGVTGAAGWIFSASSAGSNGRQAQFSGDFTATSGNHISSLLSGLVPLEVGRSYAAGCQIEPVAGATGLLDVYLQWFNLNGTQVSSTLIGSANMASYTSQAIDLVATAPFGAVTCRLQLRRGASVSGGSVSGTVRVRNVYVRRAAGGELIVDGAITAEKVAAGAIIAGKIGANAVTATEIAAGSVTSAKLTAGAVTATAIASSAITSDKVAAGAIIAGKIGAGAVTATEIAAGTITSAKLASGSVTAEKILAGAVGADQIAANAIAAKHLLISDFSNLVPDNTLSDIAGTWGVSGAAGWVFSASSAGSNGRQAQFSGTFTASGTHVSSLLSGQIPLEVGRSYAAGCQIEPISGVTGLMDVYLQWFNLNGTQVSSMLVGSANMSSYTSQAMDLVATAPFGAVTCRLQLRRGSSVSGGSVTGTVRVRNVYVRRAAGGELIVDGAITAEKVAAGAIIAGKIGANAVTATNIAAGSITAAKLAVSSLSAITANLGIVTAGRMQSADGTMTIDLDNKRIVIQ
ncbi:host specificity factor TipJ family phage tail protein [Roseibium suaedae]|uniref:host specificity factor TipJ family phage tail protein n=1 Tax=Roseibium suaedae TaxID=735517 RepID=UPI0015881FC7|nr:host specificity factor TipJ family phage tail protein [Roseibium suaedae]